MYRRTLATLLCLGAMSLNDAEISARANATETMLIQARVYRQPREGKYEFFSGITVQLLRNGAVYRQGVTGSKAGQRTVEFKNVPQDGQYSARAWVNGRWIANSTNEPFQGTGRRLDFIIP